MYEYTSDTFIFGKISSNVSLFLFESVQSSFRPTPGEVQAYMDGATAAMLAFDLMIGKMPVAHIKLRYKGNFRSAPSFTAEMTDEFKAMYK